MVAKSRKKPTNFRETEVRSYHRIRKGSSTKSKAGKGLGTLKTHFRTELSFFTIFFSQGSGEDGFQPLKFKQMQIKEVSVVK